MKVTNKYDPFMAALYNLMHRITIRKCNEVVLYTNPSILRHISLQPYSGCIIVIGMIYRDTGDSVVEGTIEVYHRFQETPSLKTHVVSTDGDAAAVP